MNVTPSSALWPLNSHASAIATAPAGRAGDSFADLLGQLRLAADLRADFETGRAFSQDALVDNQAIDSGADLDPSKNALVHGTTPDFLAHPVREAAKRDEVTAAAEMFDERGFFHRVAPERDPGIDANDRRSDLPDGAQPLGDLASESRDPLELLDAVTASRERVVRSAGQQIAAGGPERIFNRPVPTSHGSVFAAASPSPESWVPDEAEVTALEGRPKPAPRPGTTADDLPFALALNALPQGLVVAARAEGLDRAGRERLRDGLLALLSQHGLNTQGAEIRIAAPERTSTGE